MKQLRCKDITVVLAQLLPPIMVAVVAAELVAQDKMVLGLLVVTEGLLVFQL